MSVQYDPKRAKFVVRWREDGKQRVRRFATEAEADSFDADANPRGHARQRAIHPGGRAAAVNQGATMAAERTATEARDGVYPYATTRGVRWRFLYRQSDGTLSSRRGFSSRTAAVTARRRLVESIDRDEVKVSRESFEPFWTLLRRRPPGLHDGRLAP